MRESAGHLCVCPDEDRTRLLKEMVEELEKWLNQHNNTNAEIAYWVPIYILYRGTKPFAELGPMSQGMKRIAISQDIIGWRNFMEGRVSKYFYKAQHFHLTMSSSYLNGSDWIRRFITKILHITHSQWIYRNFVLHDRRIGVLRRNEREAVRRLIDEYAETRPEEVPEDSRFLLEFDFEKLNTSSFENQQYWVIAMKAATVAGQRQVKRGARDKRIRANRTRILTSRQRLGVTEVERRVPLDWLACQGDEQAKRVQHLLHQPDISTFFGEKRPSPFAIMAEMKSNIRLRKPD